MSDIPVYDKPTPQLASHPIFSGRTALLTADNPNYPTAGDNKMLQHELDANGYKYELARGQYEGVPENTFIINNPDPGVIAKLGKKYGQSAVILSNNGNHQLLYTNGENEGKYHASTGQIGFHPTQKPQDNWTQIPGLGYLRLHFDWNNLRPLETQNMATQNTQEQSPQVTKTEIRKAIGDLGKSLRGILAKHEKAIEGLGSKEANGIKKLSKAAQGNAGELPGNVYNNPGVVTKAMLGANSVAGPAPQSGQMGVMGKATKEEQGRDSDTVKERKLLAKIPHCETVYGVRYSKEAEQQVRAKNQADKNNARAKSKAQEVEKNELPGAGTGVATDDAGAYNQSMKMAEKKDRKLGILGEDLPETDPGVIAASHLSHKGLMDSVKEAKKLNAHRFLKPTKKSEPCPTCHSTNTKTMQGGKGSQDFLKCPDCSRLFRGAGNKDMKKSSELTPECEGLGCQACGGVNVEHLGDLGSRSHFICKGCGMSFSSPRQENERALNDQDLEPLGKSIYQAKCGKCDKEQEVQGAGRALVNVSCKNCGAKALKEKGLSEVVGVKLSKSLSDIRKSAGRLPDGSGFFTATVGKGKIKKKEIPQVEPATDGLPSKYENESRASDTVKERKLLAKIPHCSTVYGVRYSKEAEQQVRAKNQADKNNAYAQSKAQEVEKKEIPQVEPATDEIDAPNTKTIKNVKPKVIETDGSGSPTKGPDLKKKGMSPEAVKKLAMKKDAMDPGSTGNEIQKAGNCPTCGSHSEERAYPPHRSPIATPPCKECGHPRVAEGVRSNKESQVDKTAFLKGLVAKYSKGSKTVLGRGMSPAALQSDTDQSDSEYIKQRQARKIASGVVAKAEYRPNGPCPTCGSRYSGDYCKECRHPRLAEGLRSQVAEKDKKAAHEKNKKDWDERKGKQPYPMPGEQKISSYEKAEMGGVPKAPTAAKVTAPTANTVKAPGVKQANPTAPKTLAVKAPTTPKV